jgi:AmiR/NasT family two-component response regulator
MAMEANILVYTKSAFIYNRIENAFSYNNNVHIICSVSISDCLHKIKERAAYLSCIILYSENDEKDILLEIAKITKVTNNKIPIIMISFGNTISFINKVINSGVSDIIVMPFTDNFLIERVYKIINKGSARNRNVEIISLSLFKYLNGELKRRRRVTIRFP